MADPEQRDNKQKLREKISALRAQLQAAEAREAEAARKAQTRRLVVLGAAVIAALGRGEQVFISDPQGWLQSQPLRPQDLKAWGLEVNQSTNPSEVHP